MTKSNPSASSSAKYRTYVLGGVLAALLLYFGGEWVVENLLQGPVEEARKSNENLKEQKLKREKDLERAHQATELLVRWEKQSLPSDLEMAPWLYRAWLIELVEDVGLGNPSVAPGQPVSRGGLFHTIGFSLRGRGTLEQLTRFLFAFYRTDLLHQVRMLIITPLGDSGQLDLTLSIEAAVLARAGPEGPKEATVEERQETIFEDFRRRTWRESDRLASLRLVDYDSIITRNLFGIGGAPNPIDHAYLTAITSIDGEPAAWFKLRATDESLQLRQGEEFQIGPVAGKIAEIVGSDVIIESDGERWLLTLGERLVDAYALPPEF